MKRAATVTMFAVAVCASACIGMTPDDRARAALPYDGGEEGPTHRSGQPCLLCHSPSGGTSPYFTVAGTVYALDGITGRAGIEVTLVDVTGSVHVTTTNEIGNFMVREREWNPVFPLSADLYDGENRIGMRSPISREGSCAHCHGPALSTVSAGPVVVGAF